MLSFWKFAKPGFLGLLSSIILLSLIPVSAFATPTMQAEDPYGFDFPYSFVTGITDTHFVNMYYNFENNDPIPKSFKLNVTEGTIYRCWTRGPGSYPIQTNTTCTWNIDSDIPSGVMLQFAYEYTPTSPGAHIFTVAAYSSNDGTGTPVATKDYEILAKPAEPPTNYGACVYSSSPPGTATQNYSFKFNVPTSPTALALMPSNDPILRPNDIDFPLQHIQSVVGSYPSYDWLIYHRNSVAEGIGAPGGILEIGLNNTVLPGTTTVNFTMSNPTGAPVYFLWYFGTDYYKAPFSVGTDCDTGVTSISNIVASANPIQVNSPTTASASFSGTQQSIHSATWDWGDGTTSAGTVIENNGSGSVSNSHTYISTGVYTIKLTLTDDRGRTSTQTFNYLSVYNPTPSGLFSGARTFNSPLGSYVADSGIEGQVAFGITSKYNNNGQPTGKVNMNFSSANLDFKSTSLDVLVTSNGLATLRGQGTINGAGNYNFLVTGLESSQPGGGTVRFQIKEALSGSVVFDSQPGEADTAAPVSVATGRIIVH